MTSALLGVVLGVTSCCFWNGASVPTRDIRVSSVPFCRVWPGHQREIGQTEIAQMVRFDVEKPGVFKMVGKGVSERYRRIRPLSMANCVTIGTNEVSVRVSGPTQFVLESADAPSVHVFADAPLPEIPSPGPGGRTIRFGAGIHRPGIVAPQSGDVVVLDEGAVVQGSLQVLDATNVTIVGRGVFDASGFERADERLRRFHRERGLPEIDTESACFVYSVSGSKNVTIRGVAFVDAPFWTLVIRNQCEDVLVDGIKIVGNWRYNSDGLDVCASRNVTIRNSFFRTFDDCVIARGPYLFGEYAPVRDVVVSNCVMWADWGVSFKAQVQDFSGSTIENVLIRDCRLVNLQSDAIFLGVRYGSDLDVIRNITVEDIELNFVPQPEARAQRKDGEPFVYTPQTEATLLDICSYTLGKNMDNQVSGKKERPDYYHFIHENITLRNFKPLGEPRSFKVRVKREVPRHDVRNIVLENLPAYENVDIDAVKSVSTFH